MPTYSEAKAKRVCEMILSLESKLKIPAWVRIGAENPFGPMGRGDEASALLCSMCEQVPDRFANADDELSRWWKEYRESKKKKEEAEACRVKTREHAMAKVAKVLTDEEMEALGFK